MASESAGKVALVTGAASGIGRATALAFAADGARVVLSDVDDEGGRQTQSLISDMGGEATFIHCDVTQSEQVADLITATVKTYGRLDCAHNNAGISGASTGASPADYSEDLFDSVIAVNLKGVWLCMKHEIPQMLEQGSGAIVNTASILGLVARPGGGPAYTASKHAVIGMTKNFALTYASQGIRVNAICPGYIETPLVRAVFDSAPPEFESQIVGLHPMDRLGTPDEIARAVLWLCSDAASFVTGHSLVADGGYVAR